MHSSLFICSVSLSVAGLSAMAVHKCSSQMLFEEDYPSVISKFSLWSWIPVCKQLSCRTIHSPAIMPRKMVSLKDTFIVIQLRLIQNPMHATSLYSHSELPVHNVAFLSVVFLAEWIWALQCMIYIAFHFFLNAVLRIGFDLWKSLKLHPANLCGILYIHFPDFIIKHTYKKKKSLK